MAMLSDLFDQDGKPLPNADPLALARAMAGMQPPQTQGTAFEPITAQQQLGNYRQLEGQEQAWRTAEGSPWKPAEPGPVAQMLSRILQSEPGQRALMLADFMGPGPKVPRPTMSAAGSGGGAPKGIKAFHGSPHDFETFDLSKVGTGEGHQAFGHGLYFAEAEATAKTYRDQLAHKGVKLRETVEGTLPGQTFTQSDLGAIYSAANHGDKDPLKAARAVQMKLTHLRDDGASFMGPAGPTQQKIADAIAQLREQGRGRMYEVNIKADPETLLDWDKPLSQQPPQVRALIESNPKAAKALAFQSEFLKQEPTGKAAYRAFASGPEADPKSGVSASAALREAGIPGIRYKDAGSRGAEGGTNNYVVFDDALIEIVRKYGIAGLMAAMGLTASGDAEAAPRTP